MAKMFFKTAMWKGFCFSMHPLFSQEWDTRFLASHNNMNLMRQYWKCVLYQSKANQVHLKLAPDHLSITAFCCTAQHKVSSTRNSMLKHCKFLMSDTVEAEDHHLLFRNTLNLAQHYNQDEIIHKECSLVSVLQSNRSNSFSHLNTHH